MRRNIFRLNGRCIHRYRRIAGRIQNTYIPVDGYRAGGNTQHIGRCCRLCRTIDGNRTSCGSIQCCIVQCHLRQRAFTAAADCRHRRRRCHAIGFVCRQGIVRDILRQVSIQQCA